LIRLDLPLAAKIQSASAGAETVQKRCRSGRSIRGKENSTLPKLAEPCASLQPVEGNTAEEDTEKIDFGWDCLR